MKPRNYVAKHSRMVNKASIEPNKRHEKQMATELEDMKEEVAMGLVEGLKLISDEEEE